MLVRYVCRSLPCRIGWQLSAALLSGVQGTRKEVARDASCRPRPHCQRARRRPGRKQLVTTARRSPRRCPLTTADEYRRLRRLVAETRTAVLLATLRMHIVPLLARTLLPCTRSWSHAFAMIQRTIGG